MMWMIWLLAACSRDAPDPQTVVVEPSVQPTVGPDAAPDRVVAVAASTVEGEAAWQQYNCSACHGQRAQGGVGPQLAGRVPPLGDVVSRVRAGAAPMPAYTSAELSDALIGGIHAWLLAQPEPGPPRPNPDTLSTVAGVDVELFASGLDHPVAIVFCDGRSYVSTNGGVYPRAGQKTGKIWFLLENNERVEYATGLERPVGLACTDHGLYVSQRGQIVYLEDLDGDMRADGHVVFVDGLPASGLHQNNGLALGHQGQLFVGQGSATNAGVEDAPNNSILSIAPTGEVSVYATGFRNPFGLAWMDGALYATDNGIDPPLVEAAPEELNRVEPGAFYGHPYWVGDQRRRDGGPAATAPVAMFMPHASANGLTAAASPMWPNHEGKLLVAEFGSYISRFYTAGRRVVLVDPATGESTIWASGFQGRPLDITVGPEGAVYVTDFEQGAVWRFFASDRVRTRFEPSFDCTRASTVVEQAICNDPQLAALDGQLSEAYTAARGELVGAQRTALRDAQRAWLAQRDACENDTWPVVCTKTSMLARIAELDSAGG